MKYRCCMKVKSKKNYKRKREYKMDFFIMIIRNKENIFPLVLNVFFKSPC